VKLPLRKSFGLILLTPCASRWVESFSGNFAFVTLTQSATLPPANPGLPRALPRPEPGHDAEEA
jgi:hypothetical protein